MIGLLRFTRASGEPCVGAVREGNVYDVSDKIPSLAWWLTTSCGHVDDAIEELGAVASLKTPELSFADLQAGYGDLRLLPPVDEQDVWAAGVTYDRSRQGRQEEAADGGDVYARVYTAERPEIFFKARGPWVVGDGASVGIRRDATWNVPEPELTLVLNPAMEPIGVTVGNDMSSRDIEGANPLYLPQAKVYTASCAIGPVISLTSSREWIGAEISLVVVRDGITVLEDHVGTNRIRRTVSELTEYLGRCMTFPAGVLLMTGTGIVPPSDFSLQPNDLITVSIDGIGSLTNVVRLV